MNYRQAPRFSIQRSVHYRSLQEGVAVCGSGTTLNISSSGVLLCVDQLLSPGLPLEVTIDWLESVTLILIGRVVWSREEKAGLSIARYSFIRREL